MEFGSLAALDALLNPREEVDVEDEFKTLTNAKGTSQAHPVVTPGAIGPKKTAPAEEKAQPAAKKSKSKDIWDSEEVTDAPDDSMDPRPQPSYDIKYKQKVTTEDMFLGLGGRDNSSTSCDEMTVRVSLPDTKYADVTLDVTDTFLDCRTPKNKLGLYLPHTVNSKNGSAKWESDTCTLVVTLPIVRELDFMR
eukprot:Opistho-2@17171